MAASKNRLLWHQLPDAVRRQVERIAGDRVVAGENQPGGFSPGLASRLTLAGGGRVFAKVISSDWPAEADFHRNEARIAAALPRGVPAPRLWDSFDDGEWIGLVFDDIYGHEPVQPWRDAQLSRVLAALTDLARATTPSPVAVGTDHPRLGGWAEVAGKDEALRRLCAVEPWAADHLELLVELERDGLAAARGNSLVHFDLYPHNVLLGRERVYFVDWPHARLGNPLVDLVLLLSTVAIRGADPSPLARSHPLTDGVDPGTLDMILAAHAGFCMVGALGPGTAEYRPILDAKLTLARGSLSWLAHRIGRP